MYVLRRILKWSLILIKNYNMSQSYVKMYVHIVFHTKNNHKSIGEEIEAELYAYLGGILKNINSIPIKIGGTSDHIHVLCTLPKTVTLAKLAEEIKKSSSKWIKTKGKKYEKFFWQDGYGGFSLGYSMVDVVKKYIANQKEHHRRTLFIDEYKKHLDEAGIEYEEKYL
jgi:putative transposase